MFVVLDSQVILDAFCHMEVNCISFLWDIARFRHFTVCVDEGIINRYSETLTTCAEGAEALSRFKDWLRCLQNGRVYGFDGCFEVLVVTGDFCHSRAVNGYETWSVDYASGVLLGTVAHPEVDDRLLRDRIELYNKMIEHFNLEEVKTLCFKLGLEFDNLSGMGLQVKVRELIDFCKRDERLDQLRDCCRAERPNVKWW
ncbi:MAG: hypothetical protein M1546_23970 [Chloroflexi bacterium]|nr:hypothetical protein [Chloroflexota bacterium]